MRQSRLISMVLAAVCAVPAAFADVGWVFDGKGKQERIAPRTGSAEVEVLGNLNIEREPGSPTLFGAEFRPGSALCTVPSSPEFNYSDNFAVAVVFRADEIDFYRTILWKGDRTRNPQQIQFYLSIFNGRLEFKFKDAKGTWFNFLTSEPVIQRGVWYRVVVRFVDGRARTWINGREYKVADAYQGVEPMKELVKNDGPLYIGSGHTGWGLGYLFDGVIREVEFASPADKIAVGSDADREIERDGTARLAKVRSAEYQALSEQFRKLDFRGEEALRKEVAASLSTLKNGVDELEKLVRKNDTVAAIARFGKLEPELLEARLKIQAAADRIEYDQLFARLAGKADFGVTTLPTGQGFRRSSSAFRLFETPASVTMRAAKGEVESFQLIPIAGKKPAEVKIAFSGFRSADGATLPEGTATWGVIRDITAKQTMLGNTTEERRNYVGSWPDMIEDGNPAEIQIPAGGAVPVFFRVTVPRDAKPGDYRGVITLSNESGRKELPVELHVWSFEIPARNSIPVVFSFFLSNYRQWYGLDKITPEQNDMITRFLVSYRIPPNNIYESGIYPSIADQKKYDLNFATVGYFFDKKPLSEKELEARLAKFRPRLKAIEEAGVQDNIYFYTFDEIVGMWPEEHHNTFAAAKQVLGRFKQEFPWLRRLQTSIPHPDLRDTFDIWCPLFSYFNVRNHDVEKLQAEGVELWWYAADSPAKPFPNFFLGYPLNDLRVIMTLTYMKNIKGILYWSVNREWATNVGNKEAFYKDPSAWSPSIINAFSKREVFRNGMGNFMYPAPDGSIRPSIRLENFRDGVEDYELYKLLEGRIADLKKANPAGGAELAAEAEALLKVPPEVATAVENYNQAPQPLMKHHNEVGDMIEKIDQVLGRK